MIKMINYTSINTLTKLAFTWLEHGQITNKETLVSMLMQKAIGQKTDWSQATGLSSWFKKIRTKIAANIAYTTYKTTQLTKTVLPKYSLQIQNKTELLHEKLKCVFKDTLSLFQYYRIQTIFSGEEQCNWQGDFERDKGFYPIYLETHDKITQITSIEDVEGLINDDFTNGDITLFETIKLSLSQTFSNQFTEILNTLTKNGKLILLETQKINIQKIDNNNYIVKYLFKGTIRDPKAELKIKKTQSLLEPEQLPIQVSFNIIKTPEELWDSSKTSFYSNSDIFKKYFKINN